jgi:hypothetical protein
MAKCVQCACHDTLPRLISFSLDDAAPAMRFFDWLYYCIYRYVLKTPDRAASDAWPCIFVAFTPCMHVMFAYETVALSITGVLWPLPRKPIFILIFALLLGGSFWHYVWKGNGVRVVNTYQKAGDPQRYTRLGRIICWETLLLPFIFAAIFILSQKLTAWPPHP